MAGPNLSNYHLTFADEFTNGLSASADGKGTTWQTQFPWGGRVPGSEEQVYYSDKTLGADPFNAHDGVLDITAAPSSSNPAGRPYTSGMITTYPSFSQTYGYFEMRAQLPEGKGFWPAFWLISKDQSWPPEIDIMEAFGADNGKGEGGSNQVHTALWTNNSATGGGGWNTVPGNIYDGYHTYSALWDKTSVTYYFDGQEIARYASDVTKPLYMVANLDMGYWAGSADSSTPMPSKMSIDYIRAYSNDPNVPGITAPPPSPPGGTTTPTAPAPTPTSPTASLAAKIVVNAQGTVAQGANAHFNVLVDGQKIGEGTASTTASDYSFSTNVTADAAHKVQVQYDNDLVTSTEDRNLQVNKITINGHAVNPTDSFVTIDKGALDGVDVIAGQRDVLWNATMVVNADKSLFATTTPTPTPTPTAGATTVVVNAQGTAAGGTNAHFNLLVDGKKVGEGTAGTTAKDYSFSTNATADAAHKVQVQFDNDAVINGQDRNLIVNKVTINGHAVNPTDGIVTYDKGALDGKDVVKGQSGMWWNGTLVVSADKSFFPATATATAQSLSVDQADAQTNVWAHNANAQHHAEAADQAHSVTQTTMAADDLANLHVDALHHATDHVDPHLLAA